MPEHDGIYDNDAEAQCFWTQCLSTTEISDKVLEERILFLLLVDVVSEERIVFHYWLNWFPHVFTD